MTSERAEQAVSKCAVTEGKHLDPCDCQPLPERAEKIASRETTAAQEVNVADAEGGAMPWPVIKTTHTYTHRAVVVRPVEAKLCAEGPEWPTDDSPCFDVVRLERPITVTAERLAYPWEFPDVI